MTHIVRKLVELSFRRYAPHFSTVFGSGLNERSISSSISNFLFVVGTAATLLICAQDVQWESKVKTGPLHRYVATQFSSKNKKEVLL